MSLLLANSRMLASRQFVTHVSNNTAGTLAIRLYMARVPVAGTVATRLFVAGVPAAGIIATSLSLYPTLPVNADSLSSLQLMRTLKNELSWRAERV